MSWISTVEATPVSNWDAAVDAAPVSPPEEELHPDVQKQLAAARAFAKAFVADGHVRANEYVEAQLSGHVRGVVDEEEDDSYEELIVRVRCADTLSLTSQHRPDEAEVPGTEAVS